jgi:hypothetical protein
MNILEIPSGEWNNFLQSFARRHESWLVVFETAEGPARRSAQTGQLRLKSIAVEEEGAGTKLIFIEGETEESVVSHVIRNPTRISVTQTDEGADESLLINTRSGSTRLRFRSAILPELVDGVA